MKTCYKYDPKARNTNIILVRWRVNYETESGEVWSILRENIDDSTCAPFTENERAELAVNGMYPTFKSNKFKNRRSINGRKHFNRCQCIVNGDFRRYPQNWGANLFCFFRRDRTCTRSDKVPTVFFWLPDPCSQIDKTTALSVSQFNTKLTKILLNTSSLICTGTSEATKNPEAPWTFPSVGTKQQHAVWAKSIVRKILQ